MQKFKRLVASFVTLISLLALTPMAAHAEWKSNDSGWWYTEGNSWATGWRQIDGNWYYFYSNGYMAHDCYIGDYCLNSNGAWAEKGYASTSSGSQDNQSQTAYLPATGTKYHSKPNCGNMNPDKATKTTVSEAEREGYDRCSKCW